MIEKVASSDRSAITDAIWLCGNCHKRLDDGPARYPSDLLFERQREHEVYIYNRVGRAAADIRNRYENMH